MYKISIFNPNASIDDESIFNSYWTNFCQHIKERCYNRRVKVNEPEFVEILVENNVFMINNDLWAENEEDAIAFILRWS